MLRHRVEEWQTCLRRYLHTEQGARQAQRPPASLQDAYRFCRLVNRIADGDVEKRSLDEWRESEYANSIEGLLTYVHNPLEQQNARHVQRVLGLLGQNRTLDGAVRVLIEIGAWKPHVLVRLGRLKRERFSEKVEALAREYMTNPPKDLDEQS